jgi:hypothetical protein
MTEYYIFKNIFCKMVKSPFFFKITGSGGEHEGLMSISPPEKRGCVRG